MIIRIHKELPKDTITSQTLLVQAKLVHVGFLSFLHKHSISYQNIECRHNEIYPTPLREKEG